MDGSVVSRSILTRYFDSYDAWWGAEHSSLTRSQYRSRMPPPHPEIVPVAISIDSPVFNSLHKPTHFGLRMIALEHVVHAIRRDGERDAQKLEQAADVLLSREKTSLLGLSAPAEPSDRDQKERRKSLPCKFTPIPVNTKLLTVQPPIYQKSKNGLVDQSLTKRLSYPLQWKEFAIYTKLTDKTHE